MSVNPRNSRPIDFSLPLVDPQTGRIAKGWMRLIEDLVKSRDQTVTDAGQIHDVAPIKGRTEGIGITAQRLNATGQLISADHVAADGVNFGRVKTTALTVNQVDLAKAGVIGPLGSAKINQNVMFNYSNNATVDSIDNGTNATVRVYGPGGVGTTWHQFIGSVIGPEQPAFSGTTAYSQDTYVFFNGSVFTISTVAKDTLADGLLFCAALHTVAAGGAGGTSGGGGSGGGSKGRLSGL
jgi:hypothetical protein